MAKKKKKKQTTQQASAKQKKITNEVLESLIESAKRDYSKYIRNKEFLENPSRVLKNTKEGSRLGLELFEEMRSDDQVSAELQIRNSKAAAAPFSIIVPGGDDSDLKQAVELEKQIDPIYRKIVEEIQDAIMMGYAVIELNWQVINNRVELPGVYGHKQKEFTFTTEKELIMTTEEGKQVPVQPDRVIVATFRERKGNPFGNSLCNELFFPWFFKKHDWIYWGNYLEKFGQPTAIGYYPPGTHKDKQQLLLEALQAIQNDMAVIMPADMKAEFLEAKRGGSADGYKDFYRTCNTQISKVINLSTLMANESEFGTRAQAQVHEDISDFAPEKDTLWAAEILTDTVVERLARWNYNFSVKPKLVINYEKEKTGKETAQTDEILTKIVPITIDELYERYNKRKPQDDDIVSYKEKLYLWKDLKAKIESGELQAANHPGPTPNLAEFSPSHIKTGHIDDMDREVRDTKHHEKKIRK
jgi:phage gp29-like protein